MSSRLPVLHIIRSWALSNLKELDTCTAPAEDISVRVNWDKLKLRLVGHDWDKVGNNVTSSSQLLSNGNYKNNTSEVIKQRIKFTKQTEASYTAVVLNGQIQGCDIAMEIPLPLDVTSRTTAFGHSLTVSTDVTTHKTTSINWEVDSEVCIAPGCVTNVKVIVTNQEIRVAFQGTARLEGYASVDIVSKIDGQCLSSFGENVAEIFKWYVNNRKLRNPNVDNQCVFWAVNGYCTFQFGLQYEVTLSPKAFDAKQAQDWQCVIC